MTRDPATVVLGATGYTGRLVAGVLAGGADPFLLTGRDAGKLSALSAASGDAPTSVLDVTDRVALVDLLVAGDRVIDCAGPFTELGEPVIRACLAAGAHYFDTTGEQPFMRRIHERYHDEARRAGVTMVNGMAFEFALGDCAVALAARGLSRPVRSLDVTYAWRGAESSFGTRRTSLRILGRRAWSLEHGRWRLRPQGFTRRTVRLASGRTLDAAWFGAGEIVTAPRHLDVETVRAWMVVGRSAALAAPVVAPLLPVLVPPLRPLLERMVMRSPEPDEADRDRSRFTIRVDAIGRDGDATSVEVGGSDPYGLTAGIIVAGARRAADPEAPRGVLAPASLVEPESFLASLSPRGLTTTTSPPSPSTPTS